MFPLPAANLLNQQAVTLRVVNIPGKLSSLLLKNISMAQPQN
jgi:hypothetical protein